MAFQHQRTLMRKCCVPNAPQRRGDEEFPEEAITADRAAEDLSALCVSASLRWNSMTHHQRGMLGISITL
jgi:hypothetical protein